MTPTVDPHDVKNRHSEDLRTIDGVVTVGVDENRGVIVLGLTSEEAADSDAIPDELEGVAVETDVFGEIGPEMPSGVQPAIDAETGIGSRSQRHSPIPGGVSIGHIDITAGTSSFILEDGPAEYMASNNHVLANVNQGNPGDRVFQPGPLHDGSESVGELEGWVHVADGATVDLAWAKIGRDDITTDVVGVGGPYGEIYEPKTGDTLVSSGITTGVSSAPVMQTNVTVNVNFGDHGVIALDDQVLTESMSGPGDSGSPVLYEGRPAGMIFAGSDRVSVLMTASNIEEESGMSIKTKDQPAITMEETLWTFQAKPDSHSRYVEGVLDGDTYDVVVDRGSGIRTTDRLRSRLLDTAEIWNNSGEEELKIAREQREFVQQWIKEAREMASGEWPLIVRTHDETGAYGRTLADVYNWNEESLAAAVIQEFGSEYIYEEHATESEVQELRQLAEGE